MFEDEPQDLWETFSLGNDRERADALTAMAEASFANNDYASSLSCAEESEVLFAKLDDSFGIAHACFLQGRALRWSEKYAEALVPLSKAAQEYTANARQLFRAWVLDERGHCYGKLEQYRLAQFDFNSAALLWVGENMKPAAGMAFVESGEMLHLQNLWAEAEFEAGHALQTIEDTDEFETRARALSLRAKSLQQQGNITQAIKDNLDCVNLLAYMPMQATQAQVLTELADQLIEVAELEKALKAINNARELFKEVKHVKGLAECDYQEARVALLMEALEPAKELVQKARSVFGLTNNKARAFDCDFLLAKIEGANDNLLEVQGLESALAWAFKANYVLGSHAIYLDLARGYIALSRADAALETLQKIEKEFCTTAEWTSTISAKARALVLLNRGDEALTMLEAPQGNDWYDLDTIARAHLAAGEFSLAEAAITPVLISMVRQEMLEPAQAAAALLADIRAAAIAQ